MESLENRYAFVIRRIRRQRAKVAKFEASRIFSRIGRKLRAEVLDTISNHI